MHDYTTSTYKAAITDLRNLLRQIGRYEFKAYGYAEQIKAYRRAAAAT